ncbi:hypothetical protein [Mucilaginibacter lacusdianchii]|uniref:hypothetical protein n=1 Tax=Mucilaginibacter lacusdianchii TaxID=2684211 RepID=UPI00131CC78B|nr:hypothetical protein [Mucilaginibacter sp. JXJ CY 39]
MKYQEILNHVVSVILDGDNPKAVYDALHDLYNLLVEATGISAHDNGDDAIFLETGKAISSAQAAHCLLEVERTRRFVRGIVQAVHDLRKKFGNQRINILYAGTGPYSALVLPLTAIFSSKEIGFFLLEINSLSMQAVKNLYERFSLQEYVQAYIQADAVKYQIPDDINIHLIISETMHQALKDEPQVSIMNNLLPQLADGGIFIPQNITVNLLMIDGGREIQNMFAPCNPPRQLLGTVYEIGMKKFPSINISRIAVPKETKGFTDLSLFTEIEIYGEEFLTAYNCGLNLPVRIGSADQYAGKTIEFEYVIAERPYYHYFAMES